MSDYIPGFGNHISTEAVAGALPVGQNSPQRPAFGLYTEQLSGTAFTAPRHENRRSWLYRMRPTAEHPPYTRYEGAERFAPGTVDQPLAPNRLRWDPLPLPQADRKSVVEGKSGSVRVDLGGRRIIKKK